MLSAGYQSEINGLCCIGRSPDRPAAGHAPGRLAIRPSISTVNKELSMNSTKFASISLAAALAAILPAIPAQATSLTRTFVSASGSDSNPCTITQPCATFARAYSLTTPQGIVAALDPGKYGPITITGPVTINGNGWAAITAPANGNGITINAGQTDFVALRGLEIDGGGPCCGDRGIVINAVGRIDIADCVIQGFASEGIYAVSNNSMSVGIASTAVSDVPQGEGISLSAGQGPMRVAIDRVRISGSSFGVALAGVGTNLEALISNSNIDNNISTGIITGDPGNVTVLFLRNVTLNNTPIGIDVFTHSSVFLSQVIRTDSPGFTNTAGIQLDDSTAHAFSDGTNHIDVVVGTLGTWSFN
jgi:hypothetical protein